MNIIRLTSHHGGVRRPREPGGREADLDRQLLCIYHHKRCDITIRLGALCHYLQYTLLLELQTNHRRSFHNHREGAYTVAARGAECPELRL